VTRVLRRDHLVPRPAHRPHATAHSPDARTRLPFRIYYIYIISGRESPRERQRCEWCESCEPARNGPTAVNRAWRVITSHIEVTRSPQPRLPCRPPALPRCAQPPSACRVVASPPSQGDARSAVLAARCKPGRGSHRSDACSWARCDAEPTTQEAKAVLPSIENPRNGGASALCEIASALHCLLRCPVGAPDACDGREAAGRTASRAAARNDPASSLSDRHWG
jgi:hypothetical protein